MRATYTRTTAGLLMNKEESSGSSSDCTVEVADLTDGFHVKQTTEVCYLSRLQKLKAHHNVCERRYEKAHTKTINDERERTLFFHHSLNKAIEDDIEVPPLTRTDSVFLTKEMLEYHEDCSLSTNGISEEEYVPASSEASSDEYSEQNSPKQRPSTLKSKKKRDQSEIMEESSEVSSEYEDHPAAPAGEEPVTRRKKSTSKQQLRQKRGSGGGASVTQHKQQSAEEQSSEGEEPVTRRKKSTSKQQLRQKRGSGGGKKAKQKWSTEEVKAVEKTLMVFIRIGKTPGKQDCERCIAASPEALAHRDWRGVKFYVYNRIVSDQKL